MDLRLLLVASLAIIWVAEARISPYQQGTGQFPRYTGSPPPPRPDGPGPTANGGFSGPPGDGQRLPPPDGSQLPPPDGQQPPPGGPRQPPPGGPRQPPPGGPRQPPPGGSRQPPPGGPRQRGKRSEEPSLLPRQLPLADENKSYYWLRDINGTFAEESAVTSTNKVIRYESTDPVLENQGYTRAVTIYDFTLPDPVVCIAPSELPVCFLINTTVTYLQALETLRIISDSIALSKTEVQRNGIVTPLSRGPKDALFLSNPAIAGVCANKYVVATAPDDADNQDPIPRPTQTIRILNLDSVVSIRVLAPPPRQNQSVTPTSSNQPTEPPSRYQPTEPPSRQQPERPPSRQQPERPPSRQQPEGPSRYQPEGPPSRQQPERPPSRYQPERPPSRPQPQRPPSRPQPQRAPNGRGSDRSWSRERPDWSASSDESYGSSSY